MPGAILLAGLPGLAGAGPGEHSVVGWRTDTRGVYENATPPLTWAADKNIAWSVAMPGRSSATPVIVGDRIIVMSDPHWVICLGKQDGKVLWQKANDADQLSSRADVEDLARRQKQRDELAPRLAELNQQAQARGRAAELARQVDMLPRAKVVKSHGAIGQTCCTPVSDGSVVVAVFHSGLATCHDLDGNLRWARLLQHVGKGYGQSMSPALAGGVVGVHIDDAMYGLDLKTGKTLWTDYELQHQGSPVSLRVGGQDVFFTCEGNVRRPSDGKVLAKAGGVLQLFSTAAVHGQTAYLISENRRLSVCTFLARDGQVECQSSGRGIPKGVYYASPLVFGDRAYLWNHAAAAQTPDTAAKPQRTLHVLDLKSGKTLGDVPLPGKGNAYPSPAMAGGFVFVANDAGQCMVLWPGPSGIKQVALNSLEPHNASPVFDADCLLLRCHGRLYCIKASAEDRKTAQELRGK